MQYTKLQEQPELRLESQQSLRDQVQIVQDWPPNIEAIRAAGMQPTEHTVFTYGRTIYAPKGMTKQNKPLFAHELVHVKQQGTAAAHWWDRYLVDPKFRLWQEVPAYHRQYMIAKRGLPRTLHKQVLQMLAEHLAGPLYGALVSLAQAETLVAHGHV